MGTLVFDIETRGLDYADENSALSPFTASVATLTVYDIERAVGTVYVVGNEEYCESKDNWQLKVTDEGSLLRHFWEGIEGYDVYVGFATRRFDVPFLTHRSLAANTHISPRLQNKRLLTQQTLPFHVDLKDEYTFCGAMSTPVTLKTLANFYGCKPTFLEFNELKTVIESRNAEALFMHCRNKLEVTAKLYDQWRQKLAPPHFLNTTEL